MKRILLAGVALAVGLLNVVGAESAVPDKISKLGGKVVAMAKGQAAPFEKPILFPGEVLVNTNGQFSVAKGKVRELKEGQTLTADGVLFNPDGSVGPVFDHVVVRGGKVLVVRDGEGAPLTQNMQLATGGVLAPDATIHTPGKILRLLDGHMLKLDGTPLKSQDTIGMQNGKVFVVKDGARYELPPTQIMVMNDGTRVQGNGTVTARDGRVRTLKEGELLLVEGPVLSRR
jgi:hypothetical protein